MSTLKWPSSKAGGFAQAPVGFRGLGFRVESLGFSLEVRNLAAGAEGFRGIGVRFSFFFQGASYLAEHSKPQT